MNQAPPSSRATPHCAKFSDALLPVARHLLGCVAALPAGARVLDPFAGTGKGVTYLNEVCGFDAVGVELEPEWAESDDDGHGDIYCGDALHMDMFRTDYFDAVFTSPTYGNRMADKDMRESVAGTYMKSLGHAASPGSSCHLQWGDKYREFHIEAWIEARRKLRPGGWFLLNIKNHIRNKEVQDVSTWHVEALYALGFALEVSQLIPTPGQRHGANHDARVDGEYLHLMQLREKV